MIRVVAVDGPAASGKSSTGAEVARRLNYLHVDSGALYRAVTLVALGLEAAAGAGEILAAAEGRRLDLEERDGAAVVVLDGRPAEGVIRTAAVTAAVSRVSAIPEVRDWVNRRLRAFAGRGRGVVVDGRDIGTAVFPAAPVKIYLLAGPEERARRRLQQRAEETGPDAVAREAGLLRARDQADASRPVAPLRPAPDAVHLDTSTMTQAEVVTAILAAVRRSPLQGDVPAA